MSAIAIPKPKIWVPKFSIPKFEPWRILRPLNSNGSGLQPMGAGVIGSHQSSLSSIEGGTSGFGAAAGAAAATVTLISTDEIHSTSTTKTYSSMTLGGTTDDHYIVAVNGMRGSAARSVDSVTVDGTSCSLTFPDSRALGPDNTWNCIAICAATGNATGDVVVVHSGSTTREGVGVFLATGLESTTPTDSAQDGGTSPSVSIDVEAGGILVGGFLENVSGRTWTGLTERYEETIPSATNFYHEGASDAFASAETGRTVSINGSTRAGMSVVAFR